MSDEREQFWLSGIFILLGGILLVLLYGFGKILEALWTNGNG